MADKKRETKKVLLGELESIQDLLFDPDNIPVLDDSVPVLDDSLEELPMLTEAVDESASTLQTETEHAADTPLPKPTSDYGVAYTDTLAEDNPEDKTAARVNEENLNRYKNSRSGHTEHSIPALSLSDNSATDTQQNLFSASVDTENSTTSQNADPDQTSTKNTLNTPQPKTESVPDSATAMTENPFLPKHIRERLHTTKTLIEQIKEDPGHFIHNPQETTGKQVNTGITDQDVTAVVDEIIKEYMPKIETRLRQRLTTLALNAQSTTDPK